MKKLVMIFALIIGLLSCGNTKQNEANAAQPAKDLVEVLYFHGPQRCRTCVALEKAAKEVLDTKFAQQMKSGKVAFREIDLSTKEGEKIGDKYQVAWSSLIIVGKNGSKERVADLTEDGFRYAIRDKAKIQSLIETKITEFLK